MRAGRTIRKTGAWLALFALALQLVLSFGHIHPDELLSSSGPPGLSEVAAVQPSARQGDESPTRGKQTPGGLAHEACAICASMHMAGAAVLPEPATLKQPTLPGRPSLKAVTEYVLTAAPFLLFQTRAPPHSA
jgi:hypothetical protein